jgi:tetratricopeptide (TPR) repeat protein
MDALSETARRLIAHVMANDDPPPHAADESWGMLAVRVETETGMRGAAISGEIEGPDETDASTSPSLWVPAPGDRVGPFLVIDLLGAGAMGVVVRAFDPRLERTLAIKVIRPDPGENAGRARARLVAEARALARLSHPNVVAVYEVDVHDGLDYVAMELVDGIDLQKWLRMRPRHWRAIARVFAAAAEGLAAVHAAGLVHRDIKPANILIGRDKRVRVGDFGIATRRTDESVSTPDVSGPPSGDDDEDAPPLTEAGQVVGTPAYMAPEQHAGGVVGPAADQYAFCVSLFEALWGRRPFIAPVAKLGAAKRKPPRVPPHRGVPAWLFRIVARGLSVAPDARHPSMAALAAALRRDPSRRWRNLGGAAVIAASTVAAIVATRDDPPCTGATAQLSGIWDRASRKAIEGSFGASARPWAARMLADVSVRLDDYATRWIDMHTDTCKATRVRGEQSEALMDRRMLCLAQRRDSLAATVELLREGTDPAIDNAFTMLGRLPSIAACGDVEAMASALAPPDDPAVRHEVELARAEVARARASYDAGRYDEALDLADRVTEQARLLAYEPLLVEALVVRGDVLQTRLRHEEARGVLRQAAWSAIGIGHDAVAVEAATSLVWLESEYLRQFDAAAGWVDLARAELRRSGSPKSVAARVGNVIGVSYANVGKWDDALAEYEHALSLVADDPAEAYTAHGLRVNIANVYVNRGEGARARVLYEQEHEALAAFLGPDHPRVVLLRRLVADALSEAGELDRAIELGESALRSMALAYPNGGSELAGATMGVALTKVRAGKVDEGLVMYARARELYEAAGDLGGAALALANIGSTEVDRGDFDSAGKNLDRALALMAEVHGGDSADMVYPLVEKSEVLRAQRRIDEAASVAAEAERIAIATLGPLAHERIVAKQAVQEILAAQGRITDSIALARETLDLALRSGDVRVATIPFARSNLAELLVLTGGHAEALGLVDDALGELGDGAPAATVDLLLVRTAALRGLGRDRDAQLAAERALREAERLGLGEAADRARELLAR